MEIKSLGSCHFATPMLSIHSPTWLRVLNIQVTKSHIRVGSVQHFQDKWCTNWLWSDFWDRLNFCVFFFSILAAKSMLVSPRLSAITSVPSYQSVFNVAQGPCASFPLNVGRWQVPHRAGANVGGTIITAERGGRGAGSDRERGVSSNVLEHRSVMERELV